MQFIDQQIVAKQWLPVEIDFSMQNSAKYPGIFQQFPK